jgi:glycyl-tRNA synthetase beta chain/uncharacterized protein
VLVRFGRVRRKPTPAALAVIADLVDHPEFAETHRQIHHSVRKSEHLMRSARYAFWLAGVLGADRCVSARAALLHDLHSRLGTLSTHGAVAAKVAASMGEGEDVCRAIVPHMFPLGPAPETREGWVLVVADKIASVVDVAHFVVNLFAGKGLAQRRSLRASDPYLRRDETEQTWARAA